MVLTVMMTSAGAAVSMGSPYRIVVDQSTVTAQSMTGNTSQTGTTTGTQQSVQTQAEIDPGTLAAASLISAIALILGALASWFGGHAGTVRTESYKNEVPAPAPLTV
jgi:hypothetical protein